MKKKFHGHNKDVEMYNDLLTNEVAAYYTLQDELQKLISNKSARKVEVDLLTKKIHDKEKTIASLRGTIYNFL